MVDSAMPEVQPHAIEAARAAKAQSAEVESEAGSAQPSGSATPVKGSTDERGRRFDPELHKAGPDGKPLINSKGYITMKRGGAAQKAAKGQSFAKVPEPGAVPQSQKKAAAAVELDAKIDSTAEVSAYMVITAAQMIGGEEFKPESGEADAMKSAFANYYRVRGIVDMPPELILAVSLGGYVLPRWNKPIFKKKREGWWTWVKSRFGGEKSVDLADGAVDINGKPIDPAKGRDHG